jgi:hypothetical protein
MPQAQDKKPEPIQVMSASEKLIPKFATKIGTAKAGSSVILSFISELPGETAQMIERISLDGKTVDDLIELLISLREVNDGE